MNAITISESPAQAAAAFTAKAHSFAVQAATAATESGRAYYANQAAKYLRFAQAAQARAVEVPEVAPVAQPEPVAIEAQPEPKPVRSEADACRVRVMRRFFAVAKSSGLNCRAVGAMTAALSKYLGVVIPTRARLSSGQWAEAIEGIECGLLAW